jgi:hypothetical protein
MPELRRQKASGSLRNCRGNLQRHPMHNLSLSCCCHKIFMRPSGVETVECPNRARFRQRRGPPAGNGLLRHAGTSAVSTRHVATRATQRQAFHSDVQAFAGHRSAVGAFDEGTIEVGTRQEALSEIELELKSGNAGVLFDLGTQTQRRCKSGHGARRNAAMRWRSMSCSRRRKLNPLASPANNRLMTLLRSWQVPAGSIF